MGLTNLSKVYNVQNLDEVLRRLEEYKGDIKLIAGGTDIIVAIRNNGILPKGLIDISKIEELKKISIDENQISIGGAVTFTEVVENQYIKQKFYGLYKACKMVGSPQIRNKGTIGGNIANQSSAADSIPPLIALGSTVRIRSLKGTREVKLEHYYNNPVKDNEIITEIIFSNIKSNQILTFSKLGLRKVLAISRLSLSALIELDHTNYIKSIYLASGALGKYPMREYAVEECLINKPIEEKNILEGIKILQKSMDERLIGRPTLPYKRVAVASILREIIESTLEIGKEVER